MTNMNFKIIFFSWGGVENMISTGTFILVIDFPHKYIFFIKETVDPRRYP